MEKAFTVEKIGQILAVPQIFIDEITLSKEEYEKKYPPPPMTLRRRLENVRRKIQRARYLLGNRIGSWIAGSDLEEY